MKRILKIASFIATGVAVGALAGKITTHEMNKNKRVSSGKSAKNVKNYLAKTHFDEKEESEFSFI
jgi:hypothetical protein